MKTKYILTLLVAGSAMFAGCKKDFLEAEPSSEFLTPEQLNRAAAQDPSVLAGGVNGLYTAMFTPFIGGTTGHDDFGQKAIDIYTDMLSSDMALAAVNYGWYRDIARYTAMDDFTYTENYMPWRYYYKIVYGANGLIDVLGGNDVTPESEDNKHTMGQAKAMRAYAYFYLSQLYSKEGYGTGNEKILPLYTTAKESNLAKSTSKQVWDQMVKDLNEAITLLDGFNRGNKDKVDENVAKGLLSYVLAARGTQADWEQVAETTKEIMSVYPVTDTMEVVAVTNAQGKARNPQSGFNNVATPSWMWGVDLTLSQGIDLVSWWGQVDYYTYSYAGVGDYKTIDRNLYTAIPATDRRKGQFHSSVFIPWKKFFDPERVVFGQRQVTTDLLYMRADEFYLLNAEANARLGNEADAKTALKALLTKRLPDVTYVDALTGQALLDEIYKQTRIELWGEGKTYLAMKRFKATHTRGSNHLYEAGSSFAWNDSKLTFEVPQAEIINNPNINK